MATFATRSITLTAASLHGWRRQATWAAVAMTAIGIIYLGQHEPDRPREFDAAVVPDRSPRPWAERPKISAARIPARPETLPSTAGVTIAEVPGPPPIHRTTVRLGVTEDSTPPATTQATGPKAGTRPATTSTNLEPGSRSSPSPKTPPIDLATGKSKAETPPEAEASQQLAQASVAQPDRPMDDGHVLAGALDKCGKENFLAGIICEQKAYLRYCEGKWDQDPRCTKKGGGD